ncbi:MAG: CrcB family protein [Aliidiomarina sp.]|uniref:fluoride efflux transporter FluC n=1 Tax=Aliidiomarina sp. TaxID=1872439 RepID=UPI0025BB562C|nr:CrcB family protein [Aliidiomarina sp.]MCH8501833.1 CrcB family protein [Aliidiomarina sp.]
MDKQTIKSGHVFWRFTLAVALGGMVGALLRESVGQFVSVFADNENLFVYFTFATLMVNIVGCLGLGMVTAKRGLAQGEFSIQSEASFLFWSAGVFGALTSFSAFTQQTGDLWLQYGPIYSLVYVGLSVVLGVLAVSCGFWFYRQRSSSSAESLKRE